MLTAAETALVSAGYCRNPNDSCFGLPGTGWYPSCAGIPDVDFTEEVRVVGEEYVIARRYEAASVGVNGRDGRIVATFSTVSALLDWCRAYRRLSEPGLPAFSNSWD